jgi:tripartite-type tricarboxylate transporter receptor subunit TctC
MHSVRSALCYALAATAALLASPPLSAQQYPAKLVRLVIPLQPGGASDLIGRVIAKQIAAGLGQPVIVENRPGAGGLIGAEAGVKSSPDGYTLTLIPASYATLPSVYKLTFDPVTDITPIIQISQGPMVIVVHPSVPATTTQELIALAKANPGKLNVATSSLSNLAYEHFARMAGIRMNNVPYRGGVSAITDTIAGQTDLIFAPFANALPHVRSGKLRVIAVTTNQRVAAVPGVPTVAESALPGYEVALWNGLVGPKGLPRPIVDRINTEVTTALKSPETGERLQADGSSPIGGTPEQFLARIKKDIELWREVAREAGVQPQ